MRIAYDYIGALHNINAQHVTKNYRLAEMSDLDILKHAAGELAELGDACGAVRFADDIDAASLHDELISELADTFSCLLHLAWKHAVPLDTLEARIQVKLRLRFSHV